MLDVVSSSKKTLYSGIVFTSDFLRTMLQHKQNLFSFDTFLLLRLLAEFVEVIERKSDAFNLVYLRVAASTLFY